MFFLLLLNNTCSEPNREKKNAKDIRKTFNSPKRPPKVWIRRWNIISRKHECVVVSCRDCVRLWADVRCVCCCFSLFSHYFNSYSQIIHIVLMSYASVDKPPKYLILCVICFFSFIFLVRSFAFVSVVVFFPFFLLSFSFSLRLNLCEYHCYFKSIFDVCVPRFFSVLIHLSSFILPSVLPVNIRICRILTHGIFGSHFFFFCLLFISRPISRNNASIL